MMRHFLSAAVITAICIGISWMWWELYKKFSPSKRRGFIIVTFFIIFCYHGLAMQKRDESFRAAIDHFLKSYDVSLVQIQSQQDEQVYIIPKNYVIPEKYDFVTK